MSDSDNYKFEHELSWEEKARLNPLYSIMSDDFLKSSSTDFKEDELDKFYLQGMKFWNKWFAPIFENSVNLRGLTIIEYGVGMGRLLNQPAQFGANCIGIDISEDQLNNAKKYCPNSEIIEFKLLKPKEQISINSNLANFVYSYAVLQHIKQTSDFKFAINEMCRLTAPGGLLKFQARSLNRYAKKGRYSCCRSLSFENFSIVFYFKKISKFFWLPVVRIFKHTHWSGAGSFYSVQGIIRLLKSNGMQLLNVEFDAIGNIIWITSVKESIKNSKA